MRHRGARHVEGVRLRVQKRPLSAGQYVLLERAVRYGEARTVDGNEYRCATRTLEPGGYVTVEALTARTLIVRPTEAGRALVEKEWAALHAQPTGSFRGQLATGCSRHYPLKSGGD